MISWVFFLLFLLSSPGGHSKCLDSDWRHCSPLQVCQLSKSSDQPSSSIQIRCQCRSGFSPKASGFHRSGLDEDCQPCLHEGVTFHITTVFRIVTNVSISSCLAKCSKSSDCKAWSYNLQSRMCNLMKRPGRRILLDQYVSGVKDCKQQTVEQKWPLQRSWQKHLFLNVRPLVRKIPDDDGQDLMGFQAPYGPPLLGHFEVTGSLDFINLDLCVQPSAYSEQRAGKIAVIRNVANGSSICSSPMRSLHAQILGYKALVFVNEERRMTIEDHPDVRNMDTYIRIPTLFLDDPDVMRLDEMRLSHCGLAARMADPTFNNHSLTPGHRSSVARRTTPSKAQVLRDHAEVLAMISCTLAVLMLIALFMIHSGCYEKCCVKIPSAVVKADAIPDVSSGCVSKVDMGDLVDCPVCLEAMWPPKKVLQCLNGHIICDTCFHNEQFDKRCPSCRNNLTRPLIRNLAMERVCNAALEQI